MNRYIQYLKSYQLIKQLYIYAYLFEIYKSYQKYLVNEAITASLAANEGKISTEKTEPESKTASGIFFDLPPFSLGETHLKSKTALRFQPLILYDSRQGGQFLQNDPLGYHDSMNMYQGMNMNPYNYLDPMGQVSFKNVLRGAWSFTKTAVKTVVVVGAVAVVAAVSAPVAIVAGTGALILGGTDAAANRISKGQSTNQVIGGSLADLSGVSGVYGGITNTDIATGENLNLTEGERADLVGEGSGQITSIVFAPKVFKSTSNYMKPQSNSKNFIKINLTDEGAKYTGGKINVPSYNPNSFGVKSIADNPKLNAIFEQAVDDVSKSKAGNDYTALNAKIKNGEGFTGKDLSDAFQVVSQRFYKIAKMRNVELPNNCRLHHWNFNKSLYSKQVFNPKNIFPAGNKLHGEIHRLTSGGTNKWRGPIRINSILKIGD